MFNKGPKRELKLETSEFMSLWKAGGINNKCNKPQSN